MFAGRFLPQAWFAVVQSSYVISLAFCASPLVFPDHAAPLVAGLSSEVLTPGDSW